MEKIGLLIVDKRDLFRRGLAKLLEGHSEVEVLGICEDGLKAVESSMELQPGIVILDTELADCGVSETIQRVRGISPSTRFVVLTHSENIDDLLSTLAVGATGYLSKDATLEEVVNAIIFVASGELVISPPMAIQLSSILRQHSGQDGSAGVHQSFGLSKREKEIMNMLVEGATNREIGTTLYISENTVKVHIRNIMGKCSVRNRFQLALLVSREDAVSQNED